MALPVPFETIQKSGLIKKISKALRAPKLKSQSLSKPHP